MTINLDLIASRQERDMLRAFTQAISDIKNSTKLSQLEALISSNDIDGAIRLLGLEPASFEGLEEEIYQAYRTGGLTGAAQIGSVPTKIGTLSMNFNISAPAAVEWVRNQSSQFITEMVEGQQQLVREVIATNLDNGINPRQSALDLIGRVNDSGKRTGGNVGLTTQQAGWVSKAREELQGLDKNYLTRDLRDKRFDSLVKKAIADGKPLTKAQIDNAITQMQNKTLKYRGDVIARTESINALRAGQHESLMQAADKGDGSRNDVKRYWDASADDRTRFDHLIMEEQERIGDAPFTFPDGTQARFPGDDSLGAPAKQLIQCRCRERIEIDFIGRLKRIDGFR
jgi:hypothetical protein